MENTVEPRTKLGFLPGALAQAVLPVAIVAFVLAVLDFALDAADANVPFLAAVLGLAAGALKATLFAALWDALRRAKDPIAPLAGVVAVVEAVGAPIVSGAECIGATTAESLLGGLLAFLMIPVLLPVAFAEMALFAILGMAFLVRHKGRGTLFGCANVVYAGVSSLMVAILLYCASGAASGELDGDGSDVWSILVGLVELGLSGFLYASFAVLLSPVFKPAEAPQAD